VETPFCPLNSRENLSENLLTIESPYLYLIISGSAQSDEIS
jgi:hypothetical protein